MGLVWYSCGTMVGFKERWCLRCFLKARRVETDERFPGSLFQMFRKKCLQTSLFVSLDYFTRQFETSKPLLILQFLLIVIKTMIYIFKFSGTLIPVAAIEPLKQLLSNPNGAPTTSSLGASQSHLGGERSSPAPLVRPMQWAQQLTNSSPAGLFRQGGKDQILGMPSLL